MPKRTNIKALKQLCVYNVAKHMEYWCADYTKHFLDQGTFLYFIGPFDVLTSDLIQELINVLCVDKSMKRHYLHILIDGILEHLDLSGCRTVANKDAIVTLIANRCQRMKHLNLATINGVPGRILQDLVSALPRITTLNLKQTKCDDQVLTMIGNNSSSLRDLNVSGCPVSDIGISSLCVSFDPNVEKCPNLLKLDITNTAVSTKGVRCAIENLPKMRMLLYADLCEVLYEVYTKNEPNHCDQLQLRYLSIQQMKASLAPVVPSIEVSCQHCPFITEVHFLRGVSSAGVLALSVLKHIKILHLANCEEQLITFEDGVLPYLQSSGATLEELYLNEINQLDLGCIGVCCPSLKKLLCLIASYDSAEFLVHSHPELLSVGMKPFQKLEDCKILLHASENNFPDSYVKLLTVNSKQLKHIHFALVNALNDTLVGEILESNPLQCLENLTLESCPHVTGEGIWTILEAQNQLSVLNLLHCFEITRADFQEYQKYCRENYYNVQIEWM